MAETTTQLTTVSRPTFEQSLPEIQAIIRRRRASWKLLSYMEWEDVAQELLVHAWQKYPTYNPSRSRRSPEKALECWLNRIITNQLFNLRRYHLYKHAKPCVGGGNANGQRCVYNQGEDRCSYTRSGKQCAQCPAYAKWQKDKAFLHDIKAPVAMENHTQEVHNQQSDFMDIEAKKRIVDDKMRKRLEPWEWNVYKMLYIEHLEPQEASKRLKAMAAKRKRPLKATDPVDYQLVLKAMRDMAEEIVNIIKQEDL